MGGITDKMTYRSARATPALQIRDSHACRGLARGDRALALSPASIVSSKPSATVLIMAEKATDPAEQRRQLVLFEVYLQSAMVLT
jgi:hypothetical protein